MTDLQRRLFTAFEGEYRSILEGIRAILADFESGPDAARANVQASITDAFRLAHTLKGSAHVVGFSVVVTLAHRLESLFAKVRDGQLNVGPAEVRLIHAVLAAVEDQVLAHGLPQQPDATPIIAAVEAVLAGQAGTPAPVAPSAAAPTAAASATATATPSEPTPVRVVEVVPLPRDSDMVRLKAAHLDRLLGTAGSLLANIRGGRQVDQSIGQVSRRIDLVAREWDLLRRSSGGALQKLNHSPEFARVAQFLELIGDELRPLAKRVRAARDESRQNEWELRQLGEQLQDDAARARIVPAETILAGFGKMVRDLAAELGREIDFRFTGLEVEADRIVLQALKDPLMHMLRNSAGHGLEDGAARRALGKDPVGRLRVALSTEAGRLRLVVSDDGRGLDEAKIRARAVEGGHVAAADAERLTETELNAMIFKAGLSTAAEVTDLAGRGMGMSVVADTVTRLRGTIQVESRAAQGTTFTILVPIALANHRVILVDVGGQVFALPCAAVQSLRRLKTGDLRVIHGRPHLNVADQATPFVRLGAALGIDDPATGDFTPTVILEDEGRRVAVGVSAILDEREAIVKNLGATFRTRPAFAGAVVEADGRVSLLLSANHLVGLARAASAPAETAANHTPRNAAKPRGPLRILVVDDSITTRTLEKGILESSGHHVSLAVDGVDALAKLHGDAYDLVISDVEMPRMDGFGLVGEIKKHPKFARIPVIMVTSRERPEDRARGIGLGASAYVLKQKFDQGDLLDIIRRVV